jgi:hypothetical protein
MSGEDFGEPEVRVRLLSWSILPTLLLAAGCAGPVIDHVRPETAIMASELIRYGLDPARAECVNGRLSQTLRVIQLRRLERSASVVKAGSSGSPQLAPQDLVWVARNQKDKEVGPQVEAAISGCAPGAQTAQQGGGDAGVARPPSVPASPTAEAGAAARPAAWLNLGAAPTGQMIAVDASSVEKQAAYNQAWFRLTNPGAAPGETSYLLRIDCAARTITTMALQKMSADGRISDRRDYGAAGEGPHPVENGTVMEIAHLALCT